MAHEDHKFLRPLYRRILLVVFCAGWTVFELTMGQGMWAAIAGGMTAYGAWLFLIDYKPERAKPPEET
ncbi:DUF3329 domain-containing protein [Mesorhizobium sp. NBSH29]|uniref:DUF3329 domain-containing protein n=1 Tax=Mesorhizobium sp. NBSH29 TaxID=2654249 RepID=UPI0018968364|nr:DUF3329 domain-containing protein [Mesorhizobium sp. NBSH29]QPC86169.1 DUF3329 domain-containing protein [Mesorhizobium sp. NBSH29]